MIEKDIQYSAGPLPKNVYQWTGDLLNKVNLRTFQEDGPRRMVKDELSVIVLYE